jgi:arylformamidase
MRVIDISLPLQPTIPPWPGDQPFVRQTKLKREVGGDANISQFTTSAHYATHADAPFHFKDHGATIDQIDPARYCGPAQVVRVTGHKWLKPDLFAGVDLTAAPRLLVHTDCRRELSAFPYDYPAVAPGLVPVLAAAGIKLLGLDAPSVDPMNATGMTSHHALADADILIVENLDLRHVAPGLYELYAAPLKIVGCDGAPLRAVLVER